MDRLQAGFTLVELIAVVCLVTIVIVAAMPKYNAMLDESRMQMAKSLTASAQSQLSLEYSRRLLLGNTLAETAQNVCDMVSLSTSGADVSIVCSGNLSDANVSISATVEGQSANANWFSPQSGS
ncbi:type II secretion system protein [Solidesulfovibrio sp.]|uniref:type II secretion system protein n=1 Tax=Solidesulfovibrio sp. TaxID=2910990 RepID=UPI002B1EA93E|nr:prepilin-type N-terminal cleavage/methylation domain-containing protein [Solidesulfovibrio sp.]MEA5087671.1 prepilin-type N-terminal cleavage/methylation domain-containing protein [Solidesulfovibrio sp.]